MPPYNNNEFDIQGCHGTIAEQTDEAYYDDRSDASDDIEKGRLKFPKRIYGRDKELEKLLSIYNGLISSSGSNAENSIQEDDEEEEQSSSTANDNCVVFLSGYSGIGKSALVNEFVRLARSSKSANNNTSDVLYVSGKYSENTKSAAPFSAITEMFDKLVSIIVKNDEQLKAVRQGIKESEMIGTDSEGSRVLQSTFPSLVPLLNNGESASTNSSTTAVNPSMNAIKECTREFLSIICTTLHSPPIFFIDDLQWADAASIEMLDLLLSSPKLRRIHETNVMYICAYRSNEVDDNHPFTKLMNNVIENRHSNSVEQMDLFNLSPESITKFIADSIKCGDDEEEEEDDTTSNKEEVRELAEAVYQKTMGNIFFTMQALEELVRKNVLFYDVMCFEWRFVVSKVELADHMSDDVVTMVKSKIMDLPDDVQHLLIVMSYIPNALEVSVLKALLSCGDVSYEEDTIKTLLKSASDEGMLLYSTDSKCYIFAHDRIRQASLEIATEKDQDGLVRHISQVLQDVASQRPEMEWCIYVAVDLLNSLPPERSIPLGDLVKLNMKVSRLAGSKGSIRRQNELLHKALMCLESSGRVWKDYNQTLELYNAVIVSDHTLGSYDKARESIANVFSNAKSLDDKLCAYTHQLVCKSDEDHAYSEGLKEGLRILKIYGIAVDQDISKMSFKKEEMKMKVALKGSYSALMKIKLVDDCPILYLIQHIQKYAFFSGHDSHATVLGYRAIQYAMKNGMDSHLPPVVSITATSLAKQGKIKTAQEIGNVSLALCDFFPTDINCCALTRLMVHGTILTVLQPFHISTEPLLQVHKDLKLAGGMTEAVLGSMLSYFESYIAAGLELSPIVESKLVIMEEMCRSFNSLGFLTSFQIYRQYALNLRTKRDNPTEFHGEAYYEEQALSEMNPHASKMAIRDSSSLRLQLAFVFCDEDAMAQMLERIKDYPFKDGNPPRLHSRLCFTGLAAFAMSQKDGCKPYQKLGHDCLAHFEKLSKLGSANAKPVHLFLLAMKSPSRKSYTKAIEACSEAGTMVHLEAMSKERYASFLLNQEKDTELANEYLTSSYWLYQDWGAYAKALQLSQQNDFLKKSKRKTANSNTLSTVESSVSSSKKGGRSSFIPSYSVNTTLDIRERMFVKR